MKQGRNCSRSVRTIPVKVLELLGSLISKVQNDPNIKAFTKNDRVKIRPGMVPKPSKCFSAINAEARTFLMIKGKTASEIPDSEFIS